MKEGGQEPTPEVSPPAVENRPASKLRESTRRSFDHETFRSFNLFSFASTPSSMAASLVGLFITSPLIFLGSG